MWFPLTTLAVVVCIVLALQREGRSPLLIGLGAWALGLVTCSPLVFEYKPVDYLVTVDLFVAGTLVCVTTAYLLVREPPRERERPYPGRASEVRTCKLLGGIGILGSMLLLLDARASGNLEFSFSYIFSNLEQIRESQFEGLEESANRGALGTIGGFLAPAGVLAVLFAVRLRSLKDRWLLGLAITNGLLIAFVSFGILAGRATITNLAVMTGIGLFLTSTRTISIKPRTVLIVLAAGAAAFFLSTTFFSTREDRSAEVILQYTQRAEPRPWLKRLTDKNEAASFLMVNVGYFASPIPNFHFYMAAKDIPGPFYGGYSFPLPARFVGTAAGTWDRGTWLGLRRQVFDRLSQRGYPPNVWTTMPRDLLVDFGVIGTMFFSALLGALLAWSRNRWERYGATHYFVFQVVACFVFAFGAFTSFIPDPFTAYPLFMAVAVMFWTRVVLARPRAARARHAAGPVQDYSPLQA